MRDAFIPAIEALKANANTDLKTALVASANERALGSVDPGAVSAHLFVQAMADVIVA